MKVMTGALRVTTPVGMALGVALGLGAVSMATARAEISDGVVRFGVLNDQSGVYSDFGGRGSVIAAEMAVEDHGGKVAGVPIEILSADHQNKPDIASNTAREWMDNKGVDAILELTTSAVTLAVQELGKAKNRAILVTSASSPDLTGKSCTPVTVHWGFDSYGLTTVAAKATVDNGGDSWFFLTGDNVGSHAQEAQGIRFVTEQGGKVLGTVRHPLNSTDFSSFLLQAQGSGAKVIALANAGGDTVNAMKQAGEFAITSGGQSIVPMLAFITDIHSIGPKAAQGIKLATAFYWDRDDSTRTWSERFMARNGGRAPTMAQAGVYSMVTHFLKAVEATGSDKGDVAVAQMKKTPVNDPLWQDVRIREDGRSLNDIYLVEVKKPEEMRGTWDYYKIISTYPGDKAFRPMSEGGCPMVKP
ncbi:ABC transporter substrate-binding protein [Skermanella stibiiresistens]|uniref:ABC transporter substrate-binding protein n=1 Tax=Skermanella stibiiresistens TaxID=913326 RepID=UPI0004B970E6|nr:ABC transporter substrate-binding protein [Skermanella stibiiresistens]